VTIRSSNLNEKPFFGFFVQNTWGRKVLEDGPRKKIVFCFFFFFSFPSVSSAAKPALKVSSALPWGRKQGTGGAGWVFFFFFFLPSPLPKKKKKTKRIKPFFLLSFRPKKILSPAPPRKISGEPKWSPGGYRKTKKKLRGGRVGDPFN